MECSNAHRSSEFASISGNMTVLLDIVCLVLYCHGLSMSDLLCVYHHNWLSSPCLGNWTEFLLFVTAMQLHAISQDLEIVCPYFLVGLNDFEKCVLMCNNFFKHLIN